MSKTLKRAAPVVAAIALGAAWMTVRTAGQTTAIVGVTGAGKSTLINLIARLHDPPPGTVFVDGVDVREIPLATLRSIRRGPARKLFP